MMNKVDLTCRCNPISGVLCALLIGSIAPAYGQWVQVPSGTTSYLKDIFFLNDSVGFCVGGGNMAGFPTEESAVVLRSLDGGATWSTVLQDTGVAFTEMAAQGDTVVCLGRSAAQPDLLWASFDSGTTWHLDTLPFPEPREPKLMGNDLLFLSYQDLVRLDLSTQTAQTLFVPNIVSIFGLDGEKIYLMTIQKSIHSSADGGLVWDTIPCFMFDSLGYWSSSFGEALFACGDTIALKLTYNTVIANTTDRGLNWTWYETPLSNQVVFRSLDTLYGYMNTAQAGGISLSTDRGVNAELQQQLGFRINKVAFLPGSGLGWACGENGMIYKTTNGGFATGVPDRMAQPAPITVRPNPAHDRLTLVVPPGMQVVSIALLDSALKQVRHYHSSVRLLNTQGLATGLYLLKIETDQGIQSIKVLLQ